MDRPPPRLPGLVFLERSLVTRLAGADAKSRDSLPVVPARFSDGSTAVALVGALASPAVRCMASERCSPAPSQTHVLNAPHSNCSAAGRPVVRARP